MKPCIAVALSGGIDSLISAHLLKEKGVSVFGIHFVTGFENGDTSKSMSSQDLVSNLKQQLNIPIEGPHKEDEFWIAKLPEWCDMSGFPHADAFEPDRWLEEGDIVTVGEAELKVLFCPGHTPGHIVFYYDEQKVAWVGDVIFQGSIGRTDFPRGDAEQLVASIREKLFPLGDDVTFIPGHGPTSTFGQERQHNPFVSDSRYG